MPNEPRRTDPFQPERLPDKCGADIINQKFSLQHVRVLAIESCAEKKTATVLVGKRDASIAVNHDRTETRARARIGGIWRLQLAQHRRSHMVENLDQGAPKARARASCVRFGSPDLGDAPMVKRNVRYEELGDTHCNTTSLVRRLILCSRSPARTLNPVLFPPDIGADPPYFLFFLPRPIAYFVPHTHAR